MYPVRDNLTVVSGITDDVAVMLSLTGKHHNRRLRPGRNPSRTG